MKKWTQNGVKSFSESMKDIGGFVGKSLSKEGQQLRRLEIEVS
jgi:hypothetical protein